MTDDEVDKFMEEHAGLFRDLASAVMCPACHKVARDLLVNLGEKYYWAEGHPECLE